MTDEIFESQMFETFKLNLPNKSRSGRHLQSKDLELEIDWI